MPIIQLTSENFPPSLIFQQFLFPLAFLFEILHLIPLRFQTAIFALLLFFNP